MTTAKYFAQEIYDVAIIQHSYLWKKRIKKKDNRADFIFDSIIDLFELRTVGYIAGIRDKVYDNLYDNIYYGLNTKTKG